MTLKQSLHTACLKNINDRIKAIEMAIELTQRSANEEIKSSAGDKYETGRSMAQLEIEKQRVQLAEGNKLKQELDKISFHHTSDVIKKTGSLVFTNRGSFYIAVAAGELSMENKKFFAISPASPIAKMLIGLQKNDAFSLNGNDFIIKEVL